MEDYSKYYNYVLSNGVTVRQLQMKLLDIFLYLKKICEENNLTYWCGGGTMLGAVRHKGFIPWDNDMDVFLPRRDYEKLYEIWDKVADTSKYKLVKTTKDHNYHHTDMSLVDVTTTFVNKHSENEDNVHGCYIDVMPFEGCPDSWLGRAKQVYHSIMYDIYNVQRLPDNQGKWLRFPTKLALGLIKDPEKRYKVWSYHEKKMSARDFYTAKYVKETISSFKGLFRTYDRKMFDTVDAEFEGHIVKIPAGYDEYMKRIYGDYMPIPQHPDMSSRYGVVGYLNLDEPYTKFRGIHYLKNQQK